MVNGLQKLIYKISGIAPICVILAITLYTQGVHIVICILLGSVGLAGGIYAIIFIRRCEKKLPVLKITIVSISQEDAAAFAYLATYLIPLIGVRWADNLVVWILVATVVILLGIRMGNIGFCPILLLAGYHCYKADLSTGTECVIISRKKGVRSSKQIGQAIRISDTLMLTETGGKANV